MNFKGHLIGGLSSGLIVGGIGLWLQLPLESAVTLGGAVFIGSQFPDLDTGSIPTRWFGRIGFLFSFAILMYSLKAGFGNLTLAGYTVGLISLFSQGSKHRGLTHKYYIPLILGGLFFYPVFEGTLMPFICLGLSSGIFIHLFIDGIFPWKIKAWV